MTLTHRQRRHVESFDRPLAALLDAVAEPRVYLLVGERECRALLAGVVPEAVRDQARANLDPAWMTPTPRKE